RLISYWKRLTIDSYVDDSDTESARTRIVASMTLEEKSDAYAKMLEEDSRLIERERLASQ
ncbi:hypothetical protein BMETH_25861893681841, partial [methanotrophic bacterial endosymbiont of Bathymodiolus sp.]